MICHAGRVEAETGSFFVKWRDAAPEGFFEAEAAGLDLLRAAAALRVPKVIAVCRRQGIGILVLEYLTPDSSSVFSARALGAGLAKLHRSAVSPTAQFGLDRPNFLGKLPQQNEWRDDWTSFYRVQRLLPQIATACGLRRLPPHRERLVMSVVERLEGLLEGIDPKPALLHGDLWSGNYIPVGSEAAVLDPAVYYGEREMEIAYMELFGGFPPEVFEAYQSEYRLEAGYPFRRGLHQLYHLLNHLNHFGGPYGESVDACCRVLLA